MTLQPSEKPQVPMEKFDEFGKGKFAANLAEVLKKGVEMVNHAQTAGREQKDRNSLLPQVQQKMPQENGGVLVVTRTKVPRVPDPDGINPRIPVNSFVAGSGPSREDAIKKYQSQSSISADYGPLWTVEESYHWYPAPPKVEPGKANPPAPPKVEPGKANPPPSPKVESGKANPPAPPKVEPGKANPPPSPKDKEQAANPLTATPGNSPIGPNVWGSDGLRVIIPGNGVSGQVGVTPDPGNSANPLRGNVGVTVPSSGPIQLNLRGSVGLPGLDPSVGAELRWSGRRTGLELRGDVTSGDVRLGLRVTLDPPF
jgi:hypothetical protein